MTLTELQSKTNEELDALCAIHVMGWEKCKAESFMNHRDMWIISEKCFITYQDWRPTTDLNQAFEVVEKLNEDQLYHWESELLGIFDAEEWGDFGGIEFDRTKLTDLINASARDRIIAAMAVVMKEGEL